MKTRKSKTNEHSLEVQNYSVRIYPGRSSNAPTNISGMAMGYVILAGKGTLVHIEILPDGSKLPKPAYDPVKDSIEMCMNWCQLEGLMNLLQQADSVQAYYFEDGEGPWADVEGQFVRKKKKAKGR